MSWRDVTLKDVCDRIQYGYTASATADPIGPKFLRITDIVPESVDWRLVPHCEINNKNLQKYLLQDGDIVVARTGATTGYGKLLRNPPQSVFASYLVRFQPNREVDSEFIGHVVQSAAYKQFIKRNVGGAAQPNANAQILGSFPFKLPPLDIQKKIASILSAYDDLIENNTRRIEILEEMARRLYEEWFVHFRFPGHEQVRFKDSELGRIPEGWKPVAFSEVASFMNGFAFKPSHFTDDGLPVIKIKELKSGITADTPRCSGEVKEKYLVKDGDILFSWSAHLDAYIWRGGEGWLNQHLFKVDGIDGIPKSFLYFSLKEKMVDFRAKSMGTTMQHIKRSALNEVKFPMAAESLTSKFEELVTPILNQVLLLQRKNANLRAQRDLLLPKLVSGEIDVSGIPMSEDNEVEAA